MDPSKETSPSTRYESVRADGSGFFLLDLPVLDTAAVDESCFPDTIRTHTNMDPAQISAGTYSIMLIIAFLLGRDRSRKAARSQGSIKRNEEVVRADGR